MANETILIVDSKPVQQQILSVALKKAGYRVSVADSVHVALEQLESDVPDMVFSDTAFPDGDGFDFVRAFRADARFQGVPFVFVTEDNSLPQKMKAFEAGADDYLTTPFT